MDTITTPQDEHAAAVATVIPHVTMQSFADRIQPYMQMAYNAVMSEPRAGVPVSIGFSKECFPIWPLDAIAAIFKLLHIDYLIDARNYCTEARTEHLLVLRIRDPTEKHDAPIPPTLPKLAGYPLHSQRHGEVKRWRVIAPDCWQENEFLGFVLANPYLTWHQWLGKLTVQRDKFFLHMARGNFKVLERVVDLLEKTTNPFIGVHLLNDDVQLNALVSEHYFDFNEYFQNVLCHNIGLGYMHDRSLGAKRWGQAELKTTRVGITHIPSRYNDDKPVEQPESSSKGWPLVYSDTDLALKVLKPLSLRIRAFLRQVHERERSMVEKIVKSLRRQYKDTEQREQLAQTDFAVAFPREESVQLYDCEGDKANHTGLLCREWGLHLTNIDHGDESMVIVRVKVCKPLSTESWMSHRQPLCDYSSRDIEDYKEWCAVMSYKCKAVVAGILEIRKQAAEAAEAAALASES